MNTISRRRATALSVRVVALALALATVATVAPAGAAPAPVKRRSDIVFTETSSGPLALDLYRPEGKRDLPVLLLVHGGSWRSGSKSDWNNVAPELARAGFLVAAANYHLSYPGGSAVFPSHLDDLRAALLWLESNAANYGGDGRRIGMIGSSAGAHLTLLKAGSGTVRPDAVALYSAPSDLARLYHRNIAQSAIESFLGCRPGECPDTYRSASGLERVDRATPPVMLAYSTDEVLPLRQSHMLRDRLAELKISGKTYELKGERHGLGVARAMIHETIAFMRQQLSR